MEFELLKELAELQGADLWWFIGAIAAVAVLIAALAVINRAGKKRAADTSISLPKKGKMTTKMLVHGALCIALAFALSYIKLFSMPMGGSLTLCSMLPIAMYAWAFGPAYGFTAAFAYSLLQIIQGAWIVHPVQFVLDYFIAFTCYGLSSLFPKCLPLGVGVAGLARYACSVISGVVFFADSAAEAGYESALLYSLGYNGGTIGVETILCVIVACVPGVVRIAKAMNRKRA